MRHIGVEFVHSVKVLRKFGLPGLDAVRGAHLPVLFPLGNEQRQIQIDRGLRGVDGHLVRLIVGVYPEKGLFLQFLGRHIRQRSRFGHFRFDQSLAPGKRLAAERFEHVEVLMILYLPHGQGRTGQQHAAAQALADFGLHRGHDARSEHRALAVAEKIEIRDARVLHEQRRGVERVARVFVVHG